MGGFSTTGGVRKRTRPTVVNRRAPFNRMNQARKRAISRLANLRTGGFLGIEYKFLDCAWNSVAVNSSTDGSSGEVQPSSGCTSCISVPAQGDGESNRDGRKYTIKSVWVSGLLEFTPLTLQTTVTESAGTYLALVLDTQANGATIVSENVFINPSTNGNAMIPQPLRNLQNSKRYRILASQYIPAPLVITGQDAAASNAQVPGTQPAVSLSWKGNIVCDSIGTTANVASASDNAIHLIAYTGSQFTTAFIGKSRMRFVG